jgi:ADP-heptose:LPS heptosyltransferase
VLIHAFDGVGTLASKLWRWLKPIAPHPDPKRILVVQLDHLGDSVLTSPIFPRLKAAYPEAAIDVLASPSNMAVFEADPHVSRVRLADRNWFDRRPGHWSMMSAVVQLGRSLRQENYDLGIDVRGDVLTVLVMAIASIPRRAGWSMGGGGFLLTDVAPWAPGRHEVESRMALLDAIGIPTLTDHPRVAVHAMDRDRARVARLLRRVWPTPEQSYARSGSRMRSRGRVRVRSRPRPIVPDEDSMVVLPVGQRTEARADTGDWLHAGRFGESSPLLAVHLGAGTQAKRWPIAHWQNLISRFLADGWRVVIIGGPDDLALGAQIEPHEELIDWTGRLRITETTALLERADLFLGADSGPAHLSACANVPSVILFSGTNHAEQWRPWSRLSLVLRQQVACRPCHRKTCPLSDHPCMAGLSPDRVYDETRRWWTRLHESKPLHEAV